MPSEKKPCLGKTAWKKNEDTQATGKFFFFADMTSVCERMTSKNEWTQVPNIYNGALEGGIWWPQTSTIFLVTSHFLNEISLTSQILYWALTYFVFFLCVSLAHYLQHLQSGMLSSLLYFHSNWLHHYLIIYLRIHMLGYFFPYFLTSLMTWWFYLPTYYVLTLSFLPLLINFLHLQDVSNKILFLLWSDIQFNDSSSERFNQSYTWRVNTPPFPTKTMEMHNILALSSYLQDLTFMMMQK